MTKLSTLEAQTNIKKLGNIKVLIDSNVIGHSITHETVWVETDSDGEDLEWLGDDKPGYLARVPVQSESNLSDETTSIRYLAGIFSLAKGGSISMFESSELRDERISQPIGRFHGRGIYDYSLLQDVTINYLADPRYQVSFGSGNESIREQRKNRLGSIKDPMYQALVKVLGENNSQDAHHIYTAEINNVYCFLTMDFRLLKILDAQKNNSVIKNLKTKIMTPEMFGRKFFLYQISPRLFSYHGASFPVRADMHQPNSIRAKPSNKK